MAFLKLDLEFYFVIHQQKVGSLIYFANSNPYYLSKMKPERLSLLPPHFETDELDPHFVQNHLVHQQSQYGCSTRGWVVFDFVSKVVMKENFSQSDWNFD